jgi:hypothetical protein
VPRTARTGIFAHAHEFSPTTGPFLEPRLMPTKFKPGDHVRWNSEAGFVTGRIIAVHKKDVDYKGHTRHASPDDPVYEIKSDKTDHIAMHRGAVLHRIG